MKINPKLYFVFCCFYLINSVHCDDFKCPEKGKVGGLKVPNVLSLIDKQTAYYASVEVINPKRNNLVHDYYDIQNKVGFTDLEAAIQDKMNRRYYYHSTGEKIAVRENQCTRLDLTQNEKIESVKDWFEPTDIVANSEMFKDFVHLGPTMLMIYANKISDKASFVGSELIDGRTVNHWFYCNDPNGPYIDFYFDVKTSFPYRFSLYYPKWIQTQEAVSANVIQTVKKQVDSEEKYVYNFFIFKPLVISASDPMPYPLGYGCARKGTQPYTPLPDFSKVNEFTMDMEAVITYPNREPSKSTARVAKRGDIISYEIQEGADFVRFIEMPPPLGRYRVDERTGKCSYLTSDYSDDVTLITRWPFRLDQDFNLLYYLVMKPTLNHIPTFIGNIPLGSVRVQEYRATNFFANKVDAIVDYYYMNNETSVPSKVIFTPDLNTYSNAYSIAPTQVVVRIINYQDSYIDYEDRFDVSGCYEEPGSFTWFQLLFPNPEISEDNIQLIKELTEDFLASFIPITRIGSIHVQVVDLNMYVTVKLYDRVHFIDTYRRTSNYVLDNPSNTVKRLKVEDCEQLCSATLNCFDFSYCDNYDCSISAETYSYSRTEYNNKCKLYSRSSQFGVTTFTSRNYLSPMPQILQQIRNAVSSGRFFLSEIGMVAEDLFVVNGPEEIGDISQKVQRQGSFKLLRAEDFPMIKTDRHFNEAQLKIEKSTLNDCFMACLNDDDCNTISYCTNQNKECLLSGETSSSLKGTIGNKTSHADGCNIYQKSLINLFHEYEGKTLVLDAVKTLSDLPVGDCAQTCAQAKDFNCESFDYCENTYKRNESICFLHVNHIEIDKTHEINITNWKFAETGCSHYSKKSELDYIHRIGFALNERVKDSIIRTFDHLSLEHCASKCNSDPNCFTLEFCESIDYNQISDSSFSITSCSLTNLKPNNINQPQLFEATQSNSKICSIYINHNKIKGKSEINPHSTESTSPKETNNTKLAFWLGTIIFIMAFAGGFIGFTYAVKKGII